MKTLKKYLAFNEEKPFKEWLNDPRCIVSERTITNRLHRKWDFELAISTPNKIYPNCKVGEIYGKLKIIKVCPDSPKNRMWICECSCKNKTIVRHSAHRLLTGKVLSCGCLQPEIASINGKTNTLAFGQSSKNRVLRDYKTRAEKKGYSFELSDEDVFNLMERSCYFCGEPPLNEYKPCQSYNGFFLRNGIDRLDNNYGYTKENCVPCCKNCNWMKLNLSLQDFLQKVKQIVEFNN